jgi:hypothetical protein
MEFLMPRRFAKKDERVTTKIPECVRQRDSPTWPVVNQVANFKILQDANAKV